MQGKWTPGPWTYNTGEFGQSVAAKIVPVERGGLIADVSCWWYSREQAEANACLIAAAPLMVEAIRQFVAKVDGPALDAEKEYQALKAALAAAEGRGDE